MKPILLVISFYSAIAFSQVELPPMDNFEYQDYCDSTEISAGYYNDTSFVVYVNNPYSSERYILCGRMSFSGDILTLTYMDDIKVNCPYFEKGKQQQLLIRNRGEELIPLGESYIFCNLLTKEPVRICR